MLSAMASFRSVECIDPHDDHTWWCVPARSLTDARRLALDARRDGSAPMTLIQKRVGRKWVTIERTKALRKASK